MKIHANSPSNRGGLLICAAVTSVLALGLAGCDSGAHQMVDSKDGCIKCHDEKKLADSLPKSTSAQTVGTYVEIATDAAEVHLCSMVYPEGGPYEFVPIKEKTLKHPSDTATTFEASLEEGTWALVATNAQSDVVKSYAIVTVSAEESNSSIKL